MADPRYLPLGLAAARALTEDDTDGSTGETVGADDARADAVRAGADDDLAGATRDSDGTPVGAADAEADRVRAAQDAHGGSMAPGLVDETGHRVSEPGPDSSGDIA